MTRKLLSVFLAVPLLLGLLEAGARVLYEPQPLRRVYDPYAYRIPHPNLVDRFTNWEGESVSVALNELGMRGPSPSAEPPPGTLTLVFLGGSTTENYAWNRSDTFPELVGEAVGRRLARPIRVFNAGMSAATSGTNLARLQHQALDLDPALVVVMQGINDLIAGFHPGFRTDSRHLPRPPDMGWRPRSYLWRWLGSLRPVPSSPRTRRATPRAREVHRDEFDTFAARRVFRRNLRSMAAIARGHSLPILFLTQATRYRRDPGVNDWRDFFMVETLLAQGVVPPDVATLALGMEAFNAETLAVPTGHGVYVFDLAARLPRSEELFYDECHLTRAGNRRVAGQLAPVVEEIVRSAMAAGGP